MEFVGEYLKSIRIKKKLNIKKISKELNISESLLENFENDNFPQYINTVFLIGHIRAYAKFLHLDHNQVVNKFKIQTSYANTKVQKISKPIQIPSFLSLPKSLSLASIILIVFIVYFLFIQPNDLQPEYAMTPDLPENLEYELEITEMDIALLQNAEQKVKTSLLKKDKETLLIQEEKNKFVTSSSVIASLPKKSDLNIQDEIITLKFLNPTWIQLRDNEDKIVISKLMNQGDEYSYSLSENLNLTAGNAGNIVIIVNGLVKGKAGKVGEVIDSLIVDSNFKY
jgi:cytoskeletal protein RodZ